MTTLSVPTWYIPSFYGDIRLSADGEGTILLAERLTPLEVTAMEKLWRHGRKKDWIGEVITLEDMAQEGKHRLAAPITDVAKVIAKALKPNRKLVSAVTFANGQISEVSADAPVTGTALVVRDAPEPPARKPKAAATVAAPVRGCPAPNFDKAELRARQVLTAFLTPEQIEDFGKWNRFVTVGASGRRYMVTSRYAKDSLQQYTRSLFDLESQQALCVHDWSVPAAEEMLCLHLLLKLPNWEGYLRRLENDDQPHDPELDVEDTLSYDPDVGEDLAPFTGGMNEVGIWKPGSVYAGGERRGPTAPEDRLALDIENHDHDPDLDLA